MRRRNSQRKRRKIRKGKRSLWQNLRWEKLMRLFITLWNTEDIITDYTTIEHIHLMKQQRRSEYMKRRQWMIISYSCKWRTWLGCALMSLENWTWVMSGLTIVNLTSIIRRILKRERTKHSRYRLEVRKKIHRKRSENHLFSIL